MHGMDDRIGGDGPAGEDSAQFLARIGTDAEKWADEFMKLHGDRILRGDALGVRDTPEQVHDLLRGWFANAIAAGESKGYEEGRAAGQEAGPHG